MDIDPFELIVPGRVDLALLSNEEGIIRRAEELSLEFRYGIRRWASLREFIDFPAEARLVVLQPDQLSDRKGPGEACQTVRMLLPEAMIVCVIPDPLDPKGVDEIRKTGADVIFLSEEVERSSKLEFVIGRTLESGFQPIKAADLLIGTVIPFDLYHLLPQRGKYLKCSFSGDVMTEEKRGKLSQVSEFYISRLEAGAFERYSRANERANEAWLSRRSRAQFMLLSSAFTELALMITDQSGYSQYEAGAELYGRVEKLASELHSTLMKAPHPWEVFHYSAVDGFAHLDRAPVVACVAALLADLLKFPGVEELMMAALLSEVGLLMVPPATSYLLRRDRESEMDPESIEAFHQYPLKSVALALERKIPLRERIRTLILAKNERADGKGFPKGIDRSHIPEGSMLLSLAEAIDRRTRIRFGKIREPLNQARLSVLEEASTDMGKFGPLFAEKCRKLRSILSAES